MRRPLATTLLVVAASLAAAQGGHHVVTGGDNGHDGSFGQPWRAMQYGVDQLAPGDTLYILAGTDHE